MRGLLGIAVLLLLAWVLSEDRFRVAWRVVAAGVLLQFGLALLFLKFPPAAAVFLLLNHAVEALQKATEAGTGFVFGYLGGAELPFAESKPGASFIFAFRALPMVLVVSALATLLFYWGVLQRIVQAFAWVLRHTVGIGGPLGLGAAWRRAPATASCFSPTSSTASSWSWRWSASSTARSDSCLRSRARRSRCSACSPTRSGRSCG